MFSIKQVCGSTEKIWPDITHVWTEANNSRGIVDAAFALQGAGEMLEFYSGERDQSIYVMNERGSTVARYELTGTGAPCAQLSDLAA